MPRFAFLNARGSQKYKVEALTVPELIHQMVDAENIGGLLP